MSDLSKVHENEVQENDIYLGQVIKNENTEQSKTANPVLDDVLLIFILYY
jgi:hypothetical protein